MQTNLRMTPGTESAITVDNLEVAQFLYLLVHNQKICAVLDTITSKVVLILGRFGEHKVILDALREALRAHSKATFLCCLISARRQTGTSWIR